MRLDLPLRSHPQRLAEAKQLHKGKGIFSMDCLGVRLLTAGKDGAVVSSRVTEGGGIAAQRTFSEHHGGQVIKCVGQRDEAVFADCGNTRSICVLDDRIAGAAACVSRIEEVCVCVFLCWILLRFFSVLEFRV